MSQISDANLYLLIQEVLNELIHQYRPSADTPSFESIIAEIKENPIDPLVLNRKIMDVNKRIEELMSGFELL